MSASDSMETNILKLILQNVDFANIGDAGGLRGSATAGSLYIALHSADPGEAGSQTTNEVSYTGYSRVAVARSVAGFTVTGDVGSNAAAVTFGQCSAGSVTATHFSIGTASSGAGIILFKAALAASLAIASPIQPEFTAGQLTVTAA